MSLNMASRKGRKSKRSPLFATLVTENSSPCVFCQRKIDDEITYGKLYAIGNIQCHYFCVLLSCCLMQKGKDEEGLFGFMYPDILAEVERSKKHRCSYCGKGGATLGCCVSQCRKQFHLPCGRERSALSLFYGNYKSYCKDHAPKQKLPDHIMAIAKVRKRRRNVKNPKASKTLADLKGLCSADDPQIEKEDSGEELVCLICYEPVEGYPTLNNFWPPCCARDAWFHRTCLQSMALSAGMHYLKCPLCNDKDSFYDAVISQGYYVPDRDAAWELEQNAFAEIYERPLSCSAEECLCPDGRDYDAENGPWDIKLCLLCGTQGAHARCLSAPRLVCATCLPAAPTDLDHLAATIEKAILAEQSSGRAQEPSSGRAQAQSHGPVMRSRMSLRRTKQRIIDSGPSTSQHHSVQKTKNEDQDQKSTSASRLELNLKTPSKKVKVGDSSVEDKPAPSVLNNIENTLLSPFKMLEQGLHEKIKCMGVNDLQVDSVRVLEEMREKFKKPKPLSEKKRIINNIVDGLIDDLLKENHKTKEAPNEWNSPKKKKQRIIDSGPSTSQHHSVQKTKNEDQDQKSTSASRLELNLKTPSKKVKVGDSSVEDKPAPSVLNNIENTLLSPFKMLEQGLHEKIKCMGVNDLQVDSVRVLEEMREKFKKPKPLSEKKRIINNIVDGLFDDLLKENHKTKEAPNEWNSPKKNCDIKQDIENHEDTTNIKQENVTLSKPTPNKNPTIEIIEETTQDGFEPQKEPINVDDATKLEDDSSTSTFQLPPEFIADSDESLPLFETPKKLTVDIQKDSSLEISAGEVVNIDVLKMEEKPNNQFDNSLNKIFSKFSMPEEGKLQKNNSDMDIDSFTNQYLNEVNRAFKCNFSHKHVENDKEEKVKLRTAIDFAIDAMYQKNGDTKLENNNLKRKIEVEAEEDVAEKKRRKVKNMKRLVKHKKRETNIKVVCSEENKSQTLDLTLEPDGVKKRKKIKHRNRQNIKVKIKWKKEQLKLKITKLQSKKFKKVIKDKFCPKTLKQYVLKYSPEMSSSRNVLIKPDADVTPKKRKYVKQQKTPDNLVQTSIQNFFKTKISH